MFLSEPAWLWLLALVPLPWLHEARRRRLGWPSLLGFDQAPRRFAGWFRFLPPTLRAFALACLVIALARPRTVAGRVYVASKGVAIVAAIDHSSSMSTRDFPSPQGEPISRLDAAKRTFSRFVQGRRDDLIGLVAFADYPDTLCPPTLDHPFLLETARSLDIAPADEDQTNLGDALAWAVHDVSLTDSPQKVVVLLTDGRNQPGVPNPLDPVSAAHLAADLGIIVHAIALGPAEPSGENEGPDTQLLGTITRLAHGRLFLASNTQALSEVFQAIDKLERSPLKGTIRTRYQERFPPLVLAALGALVLDRWLIHGRWRRLP